MKDNAKRVTKAATVVLTYRELDPTDDDTLTVMTDLLTDLRHFAAAVCVDFGEAARMSAYHYEAEK